MSETDHTENDAEVFDPSETWTLEEREEYMNEMEESPILMGSYTEVNCFMILFTKRKTERIIRIFKLYKVLSMIIERMVCPINAFWQLEEMVEEFQHEGKRVFASGKYNYSRAYNFFKKAIFYAERLPKTPDNNHLIATLYGNCSLIQMKKENYRTCINDCDKALALEVGYHDRINE